jgi:hypothetical protein
MLPFALSLMVFVDGVIPRAWEKDLLAILTYRQSPQSCMYRRGRRGGAHALRDRRTHVRPEAAATMSDIKRRHPLASLLR